jgi:hypothetical protein
MRVLPSAVGVGGREQDDRAVGASFENRFLRLGAQVAEPRRLWSGEPAFEGAPPIGPAPTTSSDPAELDRTLEAPA